MIRFVKPTEVWGISMGSVLLAVSEGISISFYRYPSQDEDGNPEENCWWYADPSRGQTEMSCVEDLELGGFIEEYFAGLEYSLVLLSDTDLSYLEFPHPIDDHHHPDDVEDAISYYSDMASYAQSCIETWKAYRR